VNSATIPVSIPTKIRFQLDYGRSVVGRFELQPFTSPDEPRLNYQDASATHRENHQDNCVRRLARLGFSPLRLSLFSAFPAEQGQPTRRFDQKLATSPKKSGFCFAY